LPSALYAPFRSAINFASWSAHVSPAKEKGLTLSNSPLDLRGLPYIQQAGHVLLAPLFPAAVQDLLPEPEVGVLPVLVRVAHDQDSRWVEVVVEDVYDSVHHLRVGGASAHVVHLVLRLRVVLSICHGRSWSLRTTSLFKVVRIRNSDANFVRLTHCTKGYGVPWTMEEMKSTSAYPRSAVDALEIGPR